MLFNSLTYLVFLIIVVVLYYNVKEKKRWMLLLFVSYIFYMSWKPEYAILLAISTGVDYWVGLKMSHCASKKLRRPWLYLSLLVNLGFLITFKYLDFISEGLNYILSFTISEPIVPELGILLPIGISFYTFQSLSYSIDIYRGERKAENHLGIFALYVSFFPQLVSGPIERSTDLIPQLKKNKIFLNENIYNGSKLILWGLFQKMVVGDNLAIYVNEIFNHADNYSGAPVLLGIYFFAMQVYCDFAGYTNIAIGSAALFGIKLSENFKRPYLATSIREFWTKWHITLTTWMRDYFYIALGGNRKGFFRQQINLYLVFLAVALWHGTDIKLVLFGTLHYSYYLIQEKIKNPIHSILKKMKWENTSLFKKIIPIFITFHLVAFTWVIWWAKDLERALVLIQKSFILEHYSWEGINMMSDLSLLPICLFSLCVLEYVYIVQGKQPEIKFLSHKNIGHRWMVLYLLIFCILLLSPDNESAAFIYFQF